MSAATAVAPPPGPAPSCPPSYPSRAVKRPARPMREAMARVLAVLPQAAPAGKVTGRLLAAWQHDLATKEAGDDSHS